MELRDIEVLVTLAEELHFGRTAARLRITQARVSQVVKQQERRVGATLFERTNRRVALTPIGEELIGDLRDVRDRLDQALAKARRAARGKSELLRLGTLTWNFTELKPIFDAFAGKRPDSEVRIRRISFSNPFGPLRDGDVDVLLVWLPVREPDFTVGPVVFTEPIVLAVAAGHRLAGRASVSVEDLGDETVVGGVRPAYWRERVVPSTTPGGRPITVGPIVNTIDEMLPILSTGEAVSPIHASANRYLNRSDIALVPFHDAPISSWALVWRTSAETDLIRSFAQVVMEHGPLTL